VEPPSTDDLRLWGALLTNGLCRRDKRRPRAARPRISSLSGITPAGVPGVLVQFKHQGVGTRFASRVETGAYRIIQEALTNTARHAGGI
jgi:signal transduction histidine kinase